jgi:hypothetical protein
MSVENESVSTADWVDIPGYDGIQAHPRGDVRDKRTGRVFLVESNKHLYRNITLNGRGTSIHRLIALAFCPNPLGLTQVNHIDGNHRNNKASNLEWISPSDNVRDAIARGRVEGRAKAKPVRIIRQGVSTEYRSIVDAATAVGIDVVALRYIMDKKAGCRYADDANGSAEMLWRAERIAITVPAPKSATTAVEERDITIEGYTHLVARTDGIIYNRTTKKTVGCSDGRYLRVKSTLIDGKNRSTGAHQLIAQTFIPNPQNKPIVNHIDGVTTNNAVSNLEWVTQAENIQHAIRTGLINATTRKATGDKLKVPVYQLELDGSIVKRFESVGAAGAEIGFEPSGISAVCSSYKKQHRKHIVIGGFGWCHVSHYRGLEWNKAFVDVFPELIGRTDLSKSDFDLIRPSIARGARPVWQIEIDGTRVRLWNTRLEAEENVPNTNNISMSCVSNGERLCGSYAWEDASFEDIVEPSRPYRKTIPAFVRKILQIPAESQVTLRPEIVTLLKQNKNTNGDFFINTRPIVQLEMDGTIVRFWPGITVAKRELGYGRGVIDAVLAGHYKATGGYRWRWMTLDEMCM